jgi:hypothetical protein
VADAAAAAAEAARIAAGWYPLPVPDAAGGFACHQAWALGVLLLQLGHRWLLLLPALAAGGDAGGDVAAGEADAQDWRARLRRLAAGDGAGRLDVRWAMREVALPAAAALSAALAVPAVAARVVCALLRASPAATERAVAAAFPAAAAVAAAAAAAARVRAALGALHDAVRDERYLVGRHLVDFGEHAKTD